VVENTVRYEGKGKIKSEPAPLKPKGAAPPSCLAAKGLPPAGLTLRLGFRLRFVTAREVLPMCLFHAQATGKALDKLFNIYVPI
jgi:hypothetical protein